MARVVQLDYIYVNAATFTAMLKRIKLKRQMQYHIENMERELRLDVNDQLHHDPG